MKLCKSRPKALIIFLGQASTYPRIFRQFGNSNSCGASRLPYFYSLWIKNQVLYVHHIISHHKITGKSHIVCFFLFASFNCFYRGKWISRKASVHIWLVHSFSCYFFHSVPFANYVLVCINYVLLFPVSHTQTGKNRKEDDCNPLSVSLEKCNKSSSSSKNQSNDPRE